MTDKRYTKKREKNGQTQPWYSQFLAWLLLSDVAHTVDTNSIPSDDTSSNSGANTSSGVDSSSHSSYDSSSSGFSSSDSSGGFGGGFGGGDGMGGF